VFQQGKVPKTAHLYGEAIERRWGGFAQVLFISNEPLARLYIQAPALERGGYSKPTSI